MRIQSIVSITAAMALALLFSPAAHAQRRPAAKPKPATAKPASSAKTAAPENLKQIGVAMHSFHDINRRFPASTYDKDGKPLLSWRVHILPFVEGQALYDRFHLDEPWDSKHNKALIAQMPAIYRNPNFDDREKTIYLACTGEHAAFADGKADDGHQAGEAWASIVGRKTVAWARSVSFANIPDGASKTIMVVEADPDRAVIWTKPEDLHIDAEKPMAGLGGLRKGDFNALFGDGSVRFISSMLDAGTLKLLFDPRDGMAIPPGAF